MSDNPLRILVCGGRDYADYERVHEVLSKWPTEIACIIEGGATGADHCAKLFAVSNNIPVETYRADWKAYGRYAGPLRNTRMITEGKPDIVLAFPGGRGTADMIRQAKSHCILTYDLSKPIEQSSTAQSTEREEHE